MGAMGVGKESEKEKQESERRRSCHFLLAKGDCKLLKQAAVRRNVSCRVFIEEEGRRRYSRACRVKGLGGPFGLVKVNY